MARVTVEDCVDKIPNRFDLVLLAAQRAREISGGAELTIDRDRDKNPVVALREIAEETQPVDDLRERMIESTQTQIEVDEPEEDAMALLLGAEVDRPKPSDEESEERMLRMMLEANQRATEMQVDLFAAPPTPATAAPSPVEDALGDLDPDSLTPREALDALYRLKKLIN